MWSVPYSQNTLSHAVWRAGFKGRHSPHGCRALFSGWANEVGGFNPDAVERQLAHVTAGAVRKAYLRGEYLDERKRMMAAWSDWLDEQESGGREPYRRPSTRASSQSNGGSTTVEESSNLARPV